MSNPQINSNPVPAGEAGKIIVNPSMEDVIKYERTSITIIINVYGIEVRGRTYDIREVLKVKKYKFNGATWFKKARITTYRGGCHWIELENEKIKLGENVVEARMKAREFYENEIKQIAEAAKQHGLNIIVIDQLELGVMQ